MAIPQERPRAALEIIHQIKDICFVGKAIAVDVTGEKRIGSGAESF